MGLGSVVVDDGAGVEVGEMSFVEFASAVISAIVDFSFTASWESSLLWKVCDSLRLTARKLLGSLTL